MRRGTLLLAVVVTALTAVGGAIPAAYGAEPVVCPPGSTPLGTTCVIAVTEPGAGQAGGTETQPVSSGSSGPAVCTYGGAEIPCTPSGYRWNAARECFARLADPQPAPEDAVWQGHTDGVIVACVPPYCVVEGLGMDDCYIDLYWAPTPPGAAGPSPRELADRAVEAMKLRAGQIGTAPPAGSMGIVGVPVWLWISDPGESTTGPITRSASAGGITVSATGRLERIVYSMGDGQQIQCGAGTAYQASYGAAASPDCGHTYSSTSAGGSGQAYTISATSYWTVTWAGGGQSGTIPLDFTRTVQLRVGEVQVIVTDG